MTQKAISATPTQMGRGLKGVVGVYVWLFAGQRERIDALVGGQKRSEFIRDAINAAIEKELKRQARAKEPKS